MWGFFLPSKSRVPSVFAQLMSDFLCETSERVSYGTVGCHLYARSCAKAVPTAGTRGGLRRGSARCVPHIEEIGKAPVARGRRAARGASDVPRGAEPTCRAGRARRAARARLGGFGQLVARAQRALVRALRRA